MSDASTRAIRDSLLAMKESIQSSYELSTAIMEQEMFLNAWTQDIDYLVFSGYRRNDGYRRIRDIVELIDSALANIEKADSRTASTIYLSTLKRVAMLANLAQMIEMTTPKHGS